VGVQLIEIAPADAHPPAHTTHPATSAFALTKSNSGMSGSDLKDGVAVGPPPMKWSDSKYGFAIEEDCNGEEETQTGRDRCEVAAG